MKIIDSTRNRIYDIHRAKYVPDYCRWGNYLTAQINGQTAYWYTNERIWKSSAVYVQYENEWFYIMDNTLWWDLDNKRLEFTFNVDQLAKKRRTVVKRPRQFGEFVHSYDMVGRDNRKTSDGIKEVNDCTVVAYAMAANTNYQYAHDLLTAYGRRPKRGIPMAFTMSTLIRDGKPFKPVYLNKKLTLKTFARLYPKGRYLVIVSRHALAIIDGVIHDHSFRPGRRIEDAYEFIGENR